MESVKQRLQLGYVLTRDLTDRAVVAMALEMLYGSGRQPDW